MPMPTHINGRPVKTGSWTPDEDELLAEWQAKLGNRWSSVAKKIPGRTGQQCAQRWRHKVNPNIKKEKWTSDEDAALLELVGQFGNAWAEISRRLEGRTDQQCMGRWRRHLDPAIKRDAWQAREDAALTSLVQKHGSQWSAIAKNIDGRTAQQCRARWFHLEADSGYDADVLPSRSSSKAARPKRLQYDSSDGIEGELNAEDSLQQFHHRQHALTDIAEGDEDDEDFGYDSSKVELSDSEEDPPSQYSTPLKTAYSRAMSGSRASARSKSGRRSSLATQEGGRRLSMRGAATGSISKGPAAAPDRETAAVDKLSQRLQADAPNLASDGTTDPSQPSQVLFGSPDGASPLCQDVPKKQESKPHHQRKGSASPLFLSPLGQSSRASESQIIASTDRGFNLQQGRSSRSPPDSNEKTPSSTPPSTGVDENAEPSLAAGQRQRSRSRTTPTDQPTLPGGGITSAAGSGGGSGGQLKSPGAAWRRQQSPGINLLSLLQSPNPPGKTDLFTSPGLKRYNMVTPDWAKRKWSKEEKQQQQQQQEDGQVQGSAAAQYAPQQDDIPTAGRPLSRGNVARRLNIDDALRGRAAKVAGQSPGQSASPGMARRHVLMAEAGSGPGCGEADSDMCSPAKKCKVDPPAEPACRQGPCFYGQPGTSSTELPIFSNPGGNSLHASFLRRLEDPQPAMSSDTEAGSDCMSKASQQHMQHTSEVEDSIMQERCGPGLTDKENSTCNAFENLAVDGGEGPYFGKEHPPGTAAARMSYMQDISSTMRRSADVRLGLMALLDNL